MPASVQCLQERQEILMKHYKFECRCVACTDVSSTFPPYPTDAEYVVWLKEAGFDKASSPQDPLKLIYLCLTNLPAPKPKMPWLLRVLKSCHNAQSSKPNKWYFNLNTIIQNHYRAQGNCLFFGDTEKILTGEMDIPIIDL